jgi:hypothetical protein
MEEEMKTMEEEIKELTHLDGICTPSLSYSLFAH